MSTIPNDKRLQTLFLIIDGGGTPHEIANAVGMINRHLAASGLRLRDLTLTDPNATGSAGPADATLEKQRSLYETQLADATKRQHKIEIERDILATFVSDRVAEIAAKSANGIVERAAAGDDIQAKFGHPTWGSKVRPRKRWLEWFQYH